MGLKKLTNEKIKVILMQDDALDHSDEAKLQDAYAEYLKTLDESKLPFIENPMPIRFVMSLTQNLDGASDVLNQQISVDENGKVKQNMGAILPYLRAVIVDIENDPKLAKEDRFDFKKDQDGLASKEIVAAIHAIDGHFYLFTAHVQAKQRAAKGTQLLKKN